MPQHFLWVAWHLQNAAVKHRTYPTMLSNAMVRVNITPKSGITKGHHPTYSSNKHKVTSINGNDYLIDIMNKKELYHRHKLLLVK